MTPIRFAPLRAAVLLMAGAWLPVFSHAAPAVWVAGLYSETDQVRRDGHDGHTSYSQGAAVGVDIRSGQRWTLGVGYRQLSTDARDASGGRLHADTRQGFLNGGFEHGNLQVLGGVEYGKAEHRLRPADDYDGSLSGANLTLAYRHHLQGTVHVIPRVLARYSQVDIDDAGRVERQEVGELGAGVHLVGRVPLDQGQLVQTIRLMRYHELMDDRIDTAAVYVIDGAPLLSGGARRDRNSYLVGLGMDYQLGTFTLGASYGYHSRADFHANTASLQVQLAF